MLQREQGKGPFPKAKTPGAGFISVLCAKKGAGWEKGLGSFRVKNADGLAAM